jgi:hypothetical protein
LFVELLGSGSLTSHSLAWPAHCGAPVQQWTMAQAPTRETERETKNIPSIKNFVFGSHISVLPSVLVTHKRIFQFVFLPVSRYSDKLNGRGLIPARGKIFLFSTVSRPALGPT